MELIKENVKVNQVCCKGCVRCEVDEDIIVPDIKPDILKILQLDATACVTDKSVSDGRASVYGRTDLKILYIPDSDSEKIKSIVTSFDFSKNIDNKIITEEMKALVSANVDRAEFSLINSRKLRVKVTVLLDYEIVEEKEMKIAVDSEESGRTEILKESVSLENCVCLQENDFVLTERMEIPQSKTAIGEILKADAKIIDSEYKSVTGKIVAKGAAAVSVLYTDDEGKISFMEAELPFTEVFECDDAGDDTVCDIDYTVCLAECEAQEDSDGDRRIAAVQIKVRANIKAAENVEINMISDLYEPYMKTELIKETAELEEVVSRPVSQNTIRETVEQEENEPAITAVYDVIAKPVITNAALQNGKLITEGKTNVYILCLTDSEENPVCSVKKEIPFSFSTDAGCDGDEYIPQIKVEVKHTAYNLNMAGEVELRCILSLSANIICKRKIELIEDIVTESKDSADKRGIVIYFAQPDDNLWSISKRYAVPQSAVTEFNGIMPESEIETGMRLFIPGV